MFLLPWQCTENTNQHKIPLSQVFLLNLLLPYLLSYLYTILWFGRLATSIVKMMKNKDNNTNNILLYTHKK